MSKIVRILLVVLMFRIDWKRLLFVCAVLKLGSMFIQIPPIPYPKADWVFPPLSDPISEKPVKSPVVQLDHSHSLSVSKKLELVRDLSHVIPSNLSLGPNISPSTTIHKRPSRRSRGKHRRKKTEIITPPPPPPIIKKLPIHTERLLASMTPYEALAYAKKDIDNAPLVSNDTELYAPLFRNLSTFKRSFEWMEQILKVYIYRDGERPIFHEPHITGIYASEGWFMKLMEGNRQFVTKDPEKAHLFYLPYSSRQLQNALYVRDSHNLRPLSIYLRDYVNTIAAKYPFWNRTHGSDHFLVACHDWGPYTLKEHKELLRNTIKALCNADVSERIFVGGKDVSLPETTIRNPGKYLRDLGGKRVSQRPILAFFAGHRHGRVRPVLLKYWSGKDEDMRIYGPLPNKVSRELSYPQHMKSSKYCICPMGFEVNSPRIVEAIYYECVPVIIADNFPPPLSDVFNWDAFSVTVAEKDIPKLKEILLAIPLRRYQTLQANVKMLQKHFIWNARPVKYDLFHMILHSIWSSRLNQIHKAQSS